ncbi:MAG: hypothetical protein Q4G23_10635, partial [Clostridia bacterium]|nr:hypothetical protein [Clostridia bacterium]
MSWITSFVNCVGVAATAVVATVGGAVQGYNNPTKYTDMLNNYGTAIVEKGEMPSQSQKWASAFLESQNELNDSLGDWAENEARKQEMEDERE